MLAGLKEKRIIRRNGVSFEVDLSEGVDLSLFLLGAFQRNVTKSSQFALPWDAIIIDVGANVGSISLPLAHACPDGMVYAFEPTDFAFRKLERNIRINPELHGNVEAIRSLVSSSCGEGPCTKIFSSWKLAQKDSTRHQVHHGTAMEATGVQTTIDTFVKQRGLHRLDFIKIDTDGHEMEVLAGAVESISRFRPVIVFELTIYLLEEKGLSFSGFEDIFHPLRYQLVDTKSGKAINQDNYKQLVPDAGSTDVVALPEC